MPSEFDLNPIDLYDILKSKGINQLFHANTVATSITFLNEAHLLSRKYVEDDKLFQTAQYSDEKDKIFDIYDDIFLDFIDIHDVWKRHNKYGPFLFCFDIELLRSGFMESIRITKKNPVHWKRIETKKFWYYSDLEEFNKNYKQGNKLRDIGSMLILKGLNGKLPLRPYLQSFIFDNPDLTVNFRGEKRYLASLLSEQLLEIINQTNFIDIKRILRHKHSALQCTCWWTYNYMLLNDFENLKRLFHPKP